MADIVINDETFQGVASVTLNTESDTATFLSTDYVLVGSPLVANEAADMTETDKIYIYTGDEAGYTAGNWYFFNGTSWESGGEYGSSTGGISDNARNLLKYILDRVAYTETGMGTYVNALYQALKIVGPAPEQYTILNTLVNVTNSNGATSIAEGSAYSATLSVEAGYTWGTVSVSMGGTDITSTAYDSTTHAISIASVTGDIVIIASATAPVTTYLITNALSHVTNSNTSASIQSGGAYSGTLTAETDYTIDSVTITMGNTDITTTAYNSSTGGISIASVTGDVVITATATAEDTRFAIEYRGNFSTTTPSTTRVSLFTKDMTIAYGETLTFTIASGYKFFMGISHYGAGSNTSKIRTAKAQNQVYVYGVNNGTSFVYPTSEVVCGPSSGAKLKGGSSNSWSTTSYSFTLQSSAVTSLTFSGVCMYIEKTDESDITIDEAKSAVSWTIS